MINTCTLIGNLGKDAEVRFLEGNIAVARFSLATNKSYKTKDSDEWKQKTTWHEIVAWRQLAERCEKLKKGSLVYVEGEITNRSYKDKDGNDKYITEIVANTIRLLDKKDNHKAPDPEVPEENRNDDYSDLPF